MSKLSDGINHFSKLHQIQLKHLQTQLDARETLQRSKKQREMFLNKQKVINHQNEYDRIRNQISGNANPYQTPTTLTRRLKELEHLGAKSFERIQKLN